MFSQMSQFGGISVSDPGAIVDSEEMNGIVGKLRSSLGAI